MNIKVATFVSSLHVDEAFSKANQAYLSSLEEAVGFPVVASCLEDYDCDIKLIFIQSGGSEGYFLENFSKLKPPYYLLTTGEENSLAASLEILTYLQLHGLPGEILHGEVEDIASRIKELVAAKKKTSRLGVVGKPSDWLISSVPDYSAVKEKFGIELVEIPLAEVEEAYGLTHEEDFVSSFPLENFPKEELAKAKRLYLALESLLKKHDISGMTLRCFDLLSSLKTSGCLGLSFLNQNGYLGTCEGDVMAMVAMELVRRNFGGFSFQCNPSRINKRNNTILLAHCTIPLGMLDCYELDTHFESGTGVAIKGELKKEKITILRLSSNLKDYFLEEGEILETPHLENLCRTQILVRLDGDVSQLLTRPCGNHLVVFYGHHKKEVEELLKR